MFLSAEKINNTDPCHKSVLISEKNAKRASQDEGEKRQMEAFFAPTNNLRLAPISSMKTYRTPVAWQCGPKNVAHLPSVNGAERDSHTDSIDGIPCSTASQFGSD